MDRDQDLALALEEKEAVSKVVSGLQKRLQRKGGKKDAAQDGAPKKQKSKKGKDLLPHSPSLKIIKKGSNTVSTRQLLKTTSSISADNIKVKREELNKLAREEAAQRRQTEKELSKEDRDRRKAQRDEERKQKREEQRREREERKGQRVLEREKRKLERVMAKREDPKEAPLAAAAKEVKEKMKGLDRAQSNRELVEQMRAKKSNEKQRLEQEREAQLKEVALEIKQDEERLQQEMAQEMEEVAALQREAELLLKK